METKEKWIEQTMASIDNIGGAAANPFLYDKVMHRMQLQPESAVKGIYVRLALACTVVLIALNMLSLFHYNKEEHKTASGDNQFASEYFSYFNNY